MPRPIPFSLAILALVSACPVTAARADEAYVCDAGRIVYVKPGELGHLKRTDACIAGYYGLSVETAPVVGAGPNSSLKVPAAAPSPPAGGAEKGLQVERETRAMAAVVLVAKEQDVLKPMPAVAKVTAPLPAVVKQGPAAGNRALRTGSLPADFRNVVILNAAPGTASIFRHER